MTLVVSRRDKKIVDVDSKGAQRDLRVRALRGDSVGHAGRWVDQLAEVLGVPGSLLTEESVGNGGCSRRDEAPLRTLLLVVDPPSVAAPAVAIRTKVESHGARMR